MSIDIHDLVALLSGQYVLPTLFIIIILGLIRRYWVPGWIYDAQVKKTEQWEARALKALETTKETVDLTTEETRIANNVLHALRDTASQEQVDV